MSGFGQEVYDYCLKNEGTYSLYSLNDWIREHEVTEPVAEVFFQNLYAFVKDIIAGIPYFSARLTDSLLPDFPDQAHRVGRLPLDASIDEFGLRGTKPHPELLFDFAEHFSIAPDVMTDAARACPTARILGANMNAWYRAAPVGYAIGVHTASEVTGHEEAYGFFKAFSESPGLDLDRETPAFRYVTAHVGAEDEHSRDVIRLIDAYVALRPQSRAEIMDGAVAYMGDYRRMFDDLLERMLATAPLEGAEPARAVG